MENEFPFIKEEPQSRRGSRRTATEERRSAIEDEPRSPSRSRSPGRERSLPHVAREPFQTRSRTPACLVTEAWVKLPEAQESVYGWFREDMPGYPDAYFAVTGRYVEMTRTEMQAIRVPGPTPTQSLQMTHAALQRAARLALADPSYVINEDGPPPRRPILRHEWNSLITPGHPISLNYGFTCIECQLYRVVRRDNLEAPESLHKTYRFHCRDVAVDCHEPTRARFSFSPTREIPGLPSAPIYDPIPTREPSEVPVVTLHEPVTTREAIGLSTTSVNHSVSPPPRPRSLTPPPTESRSSSAPRIALESDKWRKSMKLWAGAVTYDGTPSLVKLKGWEVSLKEAYTAVGVPYGRMQVMQGVHYLKGNAEEWWQEVVGQPQGQELQTFDALVTALTHRFIPESIYDKAMNDWSFLRQTGTAEEYRRHVDRLAMIMPLGEKAEYNHALQGMKPDLKAEIRFRMKEKRREYCSRKELWEMMMVAEVRFPGRPPRPFFNKNRAKNPTPKASSAEASSLVVCWICDTTGHRANTCERRHTSGCARCGSKAHTLMTCPQRPNAKKQKPGQGQTMIQGQKKKDKGKPNSTTK